ncbi:MAG: ImmA/IrrE family metallo-endopeptidase [Ruminococcus flavefaciens]|nr:ImmA/IrrE family metallo-endopeptidase [Ruminococcus flavefaciens]
MTNVLDLYQYAEDQAVQIYWFSLDCAESLSYQDEDGDCFIAMNPWHLSTIGEEKVKLAHELGHCCTGSFYNRWAAFDIREKYENRADKWAVKHLIPENELDEAIASGCTDLWSLAEHFDVTQDFMRKAVCWYTHGNLAAELYF